MTFLPIVERELRQQARRPRTYALRFGAVLLAVCIGLGLLSPSFRGVIPPTETGRALFTALGLLGFGYALLAGVFVTADCLSEEKRDGTLGLLFLTDLRGHDIVLGKLVARSLNVVYGLIATFPVLALALLIGGVTGGELGRAAIVLTNTLFLSLALGMCVSAHSYDGRVAMGVALLLVTGLVALPWLGVTFGPALAGGFTAPPWSPLSPLYGALLSQDSLFAIRANDFYFALVIQHALAWALLIRAGIRLGQAWQEEPANPAARVASLLSTALVPRALPSAQARERWLETNPVLWLAKRERHQHGNFLLFAVLVLCAGLMGWLTLKSIWPVSVLTVATAWVLNTVVKLWLAAEACRRLGEARHNGALELLLVAPLRQADIVAGLLAAVKGRFQVPVILVVGLNVLLMFMGSGATTSATMDLELSLTFFVVIGIFLADAYTLTWVGLWQGLAAPTTTRGFVRTLLQVLVAPWCVFLVLAALGALLQDDGAPPGPGWLLALWFAASYLTDGLLCFLAINRIASDFREMAAGEQSFGWLQNLRMLRRLLPD